MKQVDTSSKSEIKIRKNNIEKKLPGLDIEQKAYKCGLSCTIKTLYFIFNLALFVP